MAHDANIESISGILRMHPTTTNSLHVCLGSCWRWNPSWPGAQRLFYIRGQSHRWLFEQDLRRRAWRARQRCLGRCPARCGHRLLLLCSLPPRIDSPLPPSGEPRPPYRWPIVTNFQDWKFPSVTHEIWMRAYPRCRFEYRASVHLDGSDTLTRCYMPDHRIWWSLLAELDRLGRQNNWATRCSQRLLPGLWSYCAGISCLGRLGAKRRTFGRRGCGPRCSWIGRPQPDYRSQKWLFISSISGTRNKKIKKSFLLSCVAVLPPLLLNSNRILAHTFPFAFYPIYSFLLSPVKLYINPPSASTSLSYHKLEAQQNGRKQHALSPLLSFGPSNRSNRARREQDVPTFNTDQPLFKPYYQRQRLWYFLGFLF